MNPLQQRLAEFTPEQKVRLYNNVFGTEEGQLILEDLKMRAFFYISTSDKMQGEEILINEGTRKLLLYILDMSRPLEQHEVKTEE